MKQLLSALLAALVFSLAAQAQTLRAPPIDEANRDPGFVAYRTALLSAVVQRDIETIVRLSSPEIHLSFGGSSGHQDLRAFLTVDPGQMSEEYQHEAPAIRAHNWAALETTLRMGGRFSDQGQTFSAPYTWAFALPDHIDPYAAYFVTATHVPLLDRPIRYGKEIAQLNYDVVTLINDLQGTGYLHIQLANGTAGYARRDDLRALLDYRAIFRRSDDGWQMTAFIAGD